MFSNAPPSLGYVTISKALLNSLEIWKVRGKVQVIRSRMGKVVVIRGQYTPGSLAIRPYIQVSRALGFPRLVFCFS